MSNNNNNIVDKLLYLNDTKQIIKQAIVNKGVEITPDTPFREYADKIAEISGGGGSRNWNIFLNGINYEVSNINGTIAFSGHKGYVLPSIDISNKSWEIFLKVKKSSSTSSYVSLLNDSVHWGSIAIYQYRLNTIGCALGTGSSWVFDDAMQITIPDSDDYFFIKYSFDGNNVYELSSYDKNRYLIGHDSKINSYKLSKMNLVLLSNWDKANNPDGSFMDLSESYIKVGNEYIQGGNGVV